MAAQFANLVLLPMPPMYPAPTQQDIENSLIQKWLAYGRSLDHGPRLCLALQCREMAFQKIAKDAPPQWWPQEILHKERTVTRMDSPAFWADAASPQRVSPASQVPQQEGLLWKSQRALCCAPAAGASLEVAESERMHNSELTLTALTSTGLLALSEARFGLLTSRHVWTFNA
eukprot:s2131_g5.t1